MVAFRAPLQPVMAAGIITQSNTTAAGLRAALAPGLLLPSSFLHTLSSLSEYDAPPTYTYIILSPSAAIVQRDVSKYEGHSRKLTFASPLPFPAAPTSRYLLLPPSSVLHAGVVIASSGEGERGELNGGTAAGRRGARCFLRLEASASSRPSAYVGKVLFLFYPDGSTAASRISSYNGATRSAEVYLTSGAPGTLASYVVVEATLHPAGVRLWIDGATVIDAWLHSSPPPNSAMITLDQGTPAHLLLEYRQMGGSAVARLEWKSAKGTGNEWQVIPSTRLFFDVSRVTNPITIV